MNVDLDHARIGRYAHHIHTGIVRRGIPFDMHRHSDGHRGGFGRGHKLQIVLDPLHRLDRDVDGEQVVLLSVGSDGGGAGLTMGNLAATEATRQAPARLLAFKLGGSVKMPSLEPGKVFARPPLPRFPDDVVERGAHTLLAYACDFCHGGEKLQANVGTVPDLRKASAATHA